jgi:NADH dehydrogenase
MASYLPVRRLMRILVTGGSGVVGRSTITELLKRGHSVRLLSRGAAGDVAAWPSGVEAWPGNVGTPASVRGAADGCQCVIHLVGIVDESPPEMTFGRVNVEGTRAIRDEAQRAGVGRLVFVSSLGADRGASPYHRSKFAAEAIVREFSGEWVIVRPGAVYGPGDEHLSLMLRMVRALPVVPSIGDGKQRLQPIWHEDLARGLANATDLPGIAGKVIEVAGREVITQHDLIERMQRLTDRRVPTVPVPEFIANLGLKTLNAIGVGAPIAESQLDMLREESCIGEGKPNGLIDDLGITPTPLDEGLRRFVDEQPVQLPDQGVGILQRKTFKVVVSPSPYSADRLFEYLRGHLLDVMPSLVDSAPESSNPDRIHQGMTITLALALRGHVQVRVVEAKDNQITLMTMRGHPLAGAVRFLTTPVAGGVMFEVQVFDRPANVLDWVLMRPVGDRLQETTWRQLAMNVARVAGAANPKIAEAVESLDANQAEAVERWARTLVLSQERAATADQVGEARARAT